MSDVNSEKVIFRGRPSQYINFNKYVFYTILLLISVISPFLWNTIFTNLIPDFKNIYFLAFKILFFVSIFLMIKSFLTIYYHNYVITTERLRETVGILNRNTEELELYRVKDISFNQPFNLRMFGLGSIILETSDKSTPIVILYAIKNPEPLLNKIRTAVDRMRTIKGVREID